MGDARTGRPFCRRYTLCSCKSISTEVPARDNTAAQKNMVSPKTTLTFPLNPRDTRKSQVPHNFQTNLTPRDAQAFWCSSRHSCNKWVAALAAYGVGRGHGVGRGEGGGGTGVM